MTSNNRKPPRPEPFAASDGFEPSVLRWEELPKRTRQTGRANWTPVADELRANPLRWAVVYESSTANGPERRASGIASGIKQATITAFRPQGAFDVATRRDADLVTVYVRYLPPAREGGL